MKHVGGLKCLRSLPKQHLMITDVPGRMAAFNLPAWLFNNSNSYFSFHPFSLTDTHTERVECTVYGTILTFMSTVMHNNVSVCVFNTCMHENTVKVNSHFLIFIFLSQTLTCRQKKVHLKDILIASKLILITQQTSSS